MATVNKAAGKAKSAASKRKAAEAAAAERNGKPREITVDGIDLRLPSEPKASRLYRWGRLRDNDVAGATQLLESLIGADQLDIVLDEMDRRGYVATGSEHDTLIGDIGKAAFEAYGFGGEGESQASQDS
jgi:hypothetical protein